MSHAPSSPSSPSAPCRCVVVADAALARRLRDAGTGGIDTIEVASFLAALGELGTRPADAVVGPLARTLDMADAIAGALRRLAPRARLIAVADVDATPESIAAARRAGFHVVPGDPAEAEVILDALRSAVTAGPLPPERVTVSAPREAEPSLPPPPPSPPSPTPAPADPPHDLELGDADLIDALLVEGFAALRDRARRLVTAQADIDGVALSDCRRGLPDGHAAHDVRWGALELGVLHAPPPATTDMLAPWAAWLGRWLALGHRFDQASRLCLQDELTGVWNRRHFNRFFAEVLDRAAADRRPVTLLLFDIDNFKAFNDRYGHPAGDEILQETARLMQESVREHDVVARIGGDEFAVVFWDNEEAPRRPNSAHPVDVLKAARRFQHAVYAHRFPKLLDHAPGTLTISGGLASYPWDGHTPDQLLAVADAMALESKRQGKNAITFGPTALGETSNA